MSKRSEPGGAGSQAPFPDNLRDSAEQIWLAGLGAFNKAQEEGSKMFDALVQEGLARQRKAQTEAGEKFADASQRVSSMAQEFSSRAAGQWDKLEGLFEERVARALHRLGMPTAHDVQVLSDRLAALEKRTRSGATRSAPAKKAASTAKKAPARKRTTLHKTGG